MSRHPGAAVPPSPSGGGQVKTVQCSHQQAHIPSSGTTQTQDIANSDAMAPLFSISGANAWAPASVERQRDIESDSPELVDRKVKGLLNRLTVERFESISDQIIAWTNKSEGEKDCRTIIRVIRLVFEKATDEAPWSEMYARLCRKMMEQISPNIQDDSINNSDGKPIAGGQLFRRYLLTRCQESFERGWAVKETTVAAALHSQEYYASRKAKRQGLGLVKFIGELFKLQMLNERIMHDCIKKLLNDVENPEEEEIESVCELLTTAGVLLDTTKGQAPVDVYFWRMRELTKSPNVSQRLKFILQVGAVHFPISKIYSRLGTRMSSNSGRENG